MLTRAELITVKIESEYGTDPTPAGANAVQVMDPSWSHEGARLIERPIIRPQIRPLKSLYGGHLLQVQFTCEIKGSGTIDVAPEFGPLLRACAFGETINASTSVVYAPVSTGFESVTIWYYQDGTLRKLNGCRGNVSFDLSAGGVGKATFTMVGHEPAAARTDVAIATPTYDATVPVPLINLSSLVIGSYTPEIGQLTLDMGNTIAQRGSIAAADGYGEVRISTGAPKGSFDPADTLVATHDWIGIWKARTTAAFTSGVVGSAAGNKFTLAMPAMSYAELSPADEDGVRTLAVGFEAQESSGDDEVTLTFT